MDGQTALFHAGMGGHCEVVRRLVEAGASTDKKSKVRGENKNNKAGQLCWSNKFFFNEHLWEVGSNSDTAIKQQL